jgi:alpha-tubulin suppressor-like RCC1 family protein/GH25 family lysozyme M1 (1,4-beta-N-acetylmuramidase)
MKALVRARCSFTCLAATLAVLGWMAGPGAALAVRPLGIDVSHYQGTFNWTNAKNANVEFAYCKATQSTTYTDPQFVNNERGAVQVGIPIGAYHFAQYSSNLGTNGAAAEADYFWSVIKNYVKTDGYRLMPMLDLENVNSTMGPSQAGYTKTTFSQWANAFCLTLSNNAAAAGITIKPVIYTSSSFAGSWLNSTVTNWIPWIANWSGGPQTGAPSPVAPWSTWVCWQYGSMNLPGYGSLDGDVFNGVSAGIGPALVVGGGGPTIIAQPQSLAVDPGQMASFSVTATGHGLLAYQWRFNGTNLAAATDTAWTRTNAQPIDAGRYSVAITDSNGTTFSANALLTVNAAPVITNQPQEQVVVVGHNATFSVGVAGTEPLSYQWQLDGNALADATNSTCTITGARSINAGAYTVVVSNYLGWVVSSNAPLVLVQDTASGDNTFGQGNAFVDTTDLIAVSAGAWHNLGLRAEGTVVAWGNNGSGQTTVPEGLRDAVAIAAGGYHSLALRVNGTVEAWGSDDYGQATVPAGLGGVLGIAAGTWHSVALRADGTVIVWGDNSFGQANVPAGLSNVTAVAAGGNHTLALKADGTVVAWGENTSGEGNVTGQSTVPFGLANVVAVGAGDYHSLALTKDGTIVAWGDNSQGQIGVPSGLKNAVAVVGGGSHSVALGADGTVTTWGANWNGQCELPPGMAAASAVAAGEDHTVVLLADSTPVPLLLNSSLKQGHFSAQVQTLSRKSYALEYLDILGSTNWTTVCTNGGNGALRVLADPAAGVPRRFYRMRQW